MAAKKVIMNKPILHWVTLAIMYAAFIAVVIALP
jgi:hypothetical protein